MIMQTPVTPAFDPQKAKACQPTRHEPTGRTYSWIQEGAAFSATGVFVAFLTITPAKAN